MYEDELITKADFYHLKEELKEIIQNALKTQAAEKVWLKLK